MKKIKSSITPLQAAMLCYVRGACDIVSTVKARAWKPSTSSWGSTYNYNYYYSSPYSTTYNYSPDTYRYNVIPSNAKYFSGRSTGTDNGGTGWSNWGNSGWSSGWSSTGWGTTYNFYKPTSCFPQEFIDTLSSPSLYDGTFECISVIICVISTKVPRAPLKSKQNGL